MGRRTVPVSLPVAPLLDYLDARFGVTTATPAEAIAEQTGISVRTVRRWRVGERAAVGFWTADRIATNLGSHLDLIWPRETLNPASDRQNELVAA